MNISTGVFRGVLNLNLRGWPDDQPALCIMDFKNNHPPIRGLIRNKFYFYDCLTLLNGHHIIS